MIESHLRMIGDSPVSTTAEKSGRAMQALYEILKQLERGEIDSTVAADSIVQAGMAKTHATSNVSIDLDRRRRCGFPEVVYCAGKTPAAIVEAFQALRGAGQPCLGTRVNDEQAEAVRQAFPQVIHNVAGRTVRIESDVPVQSTGRVAVITAGTSDLPVAEEAVETLHWMNCEIERITDVGVAGPHRLVEKLAHFQDADAIVVIAGMEGALPSVVGGFVPCPVVAVPTSVGYGASFGGLAALLGMLNSCASNVTVVNIDAGFKGAYVAGLIASRARRSSGRD